MNIAVLGPPGCGKGTQSKLLAAHFGLKHFLSRGNVENGARQGNGTGEDDRSLSESGQAGPRTHRSWTCSRHTSAEIGDQGHILDGYPRTLVQAKALDALLSLSAVVLFEITEEGVLSRVAGRVVDAEGRTYNLNSNRPPAGNPRRSAGTTTAPRSSGAVFEDISGRSNPFSITTASGRTCWSRSMPPAASARSWISCWPNWGGRRKPSE